MSEPIKVGDLVVVVRWPCCGAALGAIREVELIDAIPVNPGKCSGCGTRSISPAGEPRAKFTTARPYQAPLAWCRRIPPLGELDDVKQDEEITA